MAKKKSGSPLLISDAIPGRDLTKDQKKAYAMFHDWMHAKKSSKEQILRIGGIAGTGKAIPDHTLIPTPRGLQEIGDLEVGDHVFNLFGQPTEILGIYPQGKKRLYRVTFADGRVAYSSKDHIWTVYESGSDRMKDLTLEEMIDSYEDEDGNHVYGVPMPSAVEYESRDINMDPWAYAVILHSCKFKQKNLTLVDLREEVIEEFTKITGYQTTSRYFYADNEPEFKYRFIHPITKKLVKTKNFLYLNKDLMGKNSSDLTIPDMYLYNDVETRRRLLQGFMDVGGYVSAKTYHVSYTTTSRSLAESVQMLCWSLGYHAYLKEGHRPNQIVFGDSYTLHIICRDMEKKDLFYLSSKSKSRAIKCAKKYSGGEVDYDRLQIVKIEKLPEKVPMRCIFVSDPLHLFLTENYIPTHNTTLLKYLVESEKFTTKDCIVVSYTGQAVNVLRQSGVMAKTIHSTFMKSVDEPLVKDGKVVKRRGIPIMVTKWVPVKSIPSSTKLIIVDEASFLPESLEKQLAGYGVPILEMGDPIQLPPVSGKQCFRTENLDYFLTEVMRQNRNSGIFRLSMAIRNGDRIYTPDFNGNDLRFLRGKPDLEDTFFQFKPFFSHADMIITTTNKQRQKITDLYRQYIVKTNSPFPQKGERLICRRNDWGLSLGPYPLTNGTIGYAKHTVARSMVDSSNRVYYIDFQPAFVDNDYYDNLMCDSDFLEEPFGTDKNKQYYTAGQKLEYAHAITVHASQGSQADRVVYVDGNGYGDDEYVMRQRYTAITRAVKKLYYVLTYAQWSYDSSYPFIVA